jgi:peptide/nickel transport system permease protein
VLVKILGGIAAILGATLITFVLLRIAPGDPARLTLGPLASDAAVRAQNARLGLDQPIYIQYERYISQFVRGDWGFVYGAGQPVTQQLGSRLPASLELGVYAFFLAFVSAVGLAVLATYRRRPWLDGAVRTASYIGYGTPPFWFALLALYVLFLRFHLFPAPEGRLSGNLTPPRSITGFYTVDAILSGQFHVFLDSVWHLILPAVTLALVPFAYLVRLLRGNLLDVSHEPYILVARSKGVSELRAFTSHALHNAFFPTLTAAALLFAQLLAGSVLVEKVFNWPGIGALTVDSIQRQDFAIVQAVILLSACGYVVINLVVEGLYGVLDPRVRRGAQ